MAALRTGREFADYGQECSDAIKGTIGRYT
jgi:hypothetical protein